MSSTIADHNWSWDRAIRDTLHAQARKHGTKQVARECNNTPPDTFRKWKSGQTRAQAAPLAKLVVENPEVREKFFRLILAQRPESRAQILRILEEQTCASR